MPRDALPPEQTSDITVDGVLVRIYLVSASTMRWAKPGEIVKAMSRGRPPVPRIWESTVHWRIVALDTRQALGEIKRNPNGTYSAGPLHPSERDFLALVKHLMRRRGLLPPEPRRT